MSEKSRPPSEDPTPAAAIAAQARVHHDLLLGLQLVLATRKGAATTGEWAFRLFRRQHLAKFLSSFDKLGLRGLPHAVACARYHVLSNDIGGVAVEFMEESDRKAWVRFRYPRWMYAGPVICGIPVEVSRGFLRGWYAHNGVSLGNPRLGFVCVSEDMTGEFGLCGYFLEHDRPLAEHERLRFAPGERPPRFDPARQPAPPPQHWDEARLAKARRNYAMEYVRNGLVELSGLVGADQALALGGHAARLIGMQCWRETAALVGARDGGADCAAAYLAAMFRGMGDEVRVEPGASPARAVVVQRGVRFLRDLDPAHREVLFGAWRELWAGAVRAHGPMLALDADADARAPGAEDAIVWTVREAG